MPFREAAGLASSRMRKAARNRFMLRIVNTSSSEIRCPNYLFLFVFIFNCVCLNNMYLTNIY